MSSELPTVYLVALNLQPAAPANPNNVDDLGVSPVGPPGKEHWGLNIEVDCLKGKEERLDPKAVGSNNPATGFSPQATIQVDNDVVPELIDNNVPDHTVMALSLVQGPQEPRNLDTFLISGYSMPLLYVQAASVRTLRPRPFTHLERFEKHKAKSSEKENTNGKDGPGNHWHKGKKKQVDRLSVRDGRRRGHLNGGLSGRSRGRTACRRRALALEVGAGAWQYVLVTAVPAGDTIPAARLPDQAGVVQVSVAHRPVEGEACKDPRSVQGSRVPSIRVHAHLVRRRRSNAASGEPCELCERDAGPAGAIIADHFSDGLHILRRKTSQSFWLPLALLGSQDVVHHPSALHGFKVRQQVDHVLHDVDSEQCLAARSRASLKREDLFKSPLATMLRSNGLEYLRCPGSGCQAEGFPRRRQRAWPGYREQVGLSTLPGQAKLPASPQKCPVDMVDPIPGDITQDATLRHPDNLFRRMAAEKNALEFYGQQLTNPKPRLRRYRRSNLRWSLKRRYRVASHAGGRKVLFIVECNALHQLIRGSTVSGLVFEISALNIDYTTVILMLSGDSNSERPPITSTLGDPQLDARPAYPSKALARACGTRPQSHTDTQQPNLRWFLVSRFSLIDILYASGAYGRWSQSHTDTELNRRPTGYCALCSRTDRVAPTHRRPTPIAAHFTLAETVVSKACRRGASADKFPLLIYVASYSSVASHSSRSRHLHNPGHATCAIQVTPPAQKHVSWIDQTNDDRRPRTRRMSSTSPRPPVNEVPPSCAVYASELAVICGGMHGAHLRSIQNDVTPSLLVKDDTDTQLNVSICASDPVRIFAALFVGVSGWTGRPALTNECAFFRRECLAVGNGGRGFVVTTRGHQIRHVPPPSSRAVTTLSRSALLCSTRGHNDFGGRIHQLAACGHTLDTQSDRVMSIISTIFRATSCVFGKYILLHGVLASRSLSRVSAHSALRALGRDIESQRRPSQHPSSSSLHHPSESSVQIRPAPPFPVTGFASDTEQAADSKTRCSPPSRPVQRSQAWTK
ncbi:uncharacterized protein B0H18DRAFT_1103892, partial [Fomitopsis serialis]|uniref:uncharacterized protein n=1 Tax=Fomitopsis serialis TaxID=139415 RepID=UPI002007B793